MATLGPNDLKQYALPPGWDAARLSQLALASGENYDGLVTDITAALAIANADLMADPIIGSLVCENPEQTVEVGTGVSNGFVDHTEYGLPDGQRGKTTGWMLEPVSKDYKFSWTWDFLRKCRRFQIDNDVQVGMDELANVWEKTILQRLFKSTYTAVGSAGKSMPVADGGTADSTYVPWNLPARATAFAYTHDHRQNLNGITQTNLETCVAHLWEHGIDAPYDLLIAQADVASWSNTTNVTGYVKRADDMIRYGTQTDLASVGPGYIAAIETSVYGPVRVRASARIPTTYAVLYKSYGSGDSRNVMRLAPGPLGGLGAVLLAGQYMRQYPLENALLFLEFYLGIQDRIGAVLFKNTAGGWSDPTIV